MWSWLQFIARRVRRRRLPNNDHWHYVRMFVIYSGRFVQLFAGGAQWTTPTTSTRSAPGSTRLFSSNWRRARLEDGDTADRRDQRSVGEGDGRDWKMVTPQIDGISDPWVSSPSTGVSRRNGSESHPSERAQWNHGDSQTYNRTSNISAIIDRSSLVVPGAAGQFINILEDTGATVTYQPCHVAEAEIPVPARS